MDSTATGLYQHAQPSAPGLYPMGFPTGSRGTAPSSSNSINNKNSSTAPFSASTGNNGGFDNNDSIGVGHMSSGSARYATPSSECNINMRSNGIPMTLGNSAVTNTSESASSNSNTSVAAAAAAAAVVAAAMNPCYGSGSIGLSQPYTVPSQGVSVASDFTAGVALDHNGCPLYPGIPQMHPNSVANHQHGVTGDQQHCLTPMSGIPSDSNYSPFSAPASASGNNGTYIPSNGRVSVIGDPPSTETASVPATAHAYPANVPSFGKSNDAYFQT
ncbi:hypothetical protein IWW48_005217 [Coemansia sp. RSA 1200]|nr:hypothetical protein IWW48_005217 [Coemansia sp. RSA 1200]